MLKLENLSLKKGDFFINKVSLELESSKIHILLGPSGSGKTLLLESILGMNQIQSGSISYQDKIIHDTPIESRMISYVPQDLCLFSHLNVKQNILYPLQFSKQNLDQKKLTRLCNILEISNLLDRSIHHLSGGEKQRIAIARALMTDNKLLVLDEPFSSLHQQLRQELWVQLKQIQKEFRLCILMVTHDLNEALFLSDYLYLIMDGVLHDITRVDGSLKYPNSKNALKFLGIKNYFKLDMNHLDKQNVECAVSNHEIQISKKEFDQKLTGYHFQGIVQEMFHMNHGTLLHVIDQKTTKTVEVFVTLAQTRSLNLVQNQSYYFYICSKNFIFFN